MALRIQDVAVDRELEAFLPPLTKDEETELRASIERDGFIDPIITWLGHAVVADGHHRLRIWKDSGADPDTAPEVVEKRFSDRADVMLWMLQRQGARRNWTAAQKAALALKMKPALQERAKQNEKEGGKTGGKSRPKGSMNSSNPIETVDTRKEIAKAAGVSEQTVNRVERVLEKAAEPVKTAMLSGETSVKAAYETIAPPKKNGKPSGGTSFNPAEFDPAVNPELPATKVDKSQPLEKRIQEQNRIVESFARSLVKFFDDNLPSDPWLDESRANIARDQIKSAASTVRLAKACDKPCPKCEGKGTKCKFCRGCGYLPKNSYEMAGGK